MNERPRPRGKVGIGNRPVDREVSTPTEPSPRTVLETYATLGVLLQQGLEKTPEQILMDSIREAEALDSHKVSTFHLSLPLEEQNEIYAANRPSLLGVHFAEYTLLRQRGLSHQDALVLAQQAARIKWGDPASDQPTSS